MPNEVLQLSFDPHSPVCFPFVFASANDVSALVLQHQSRSSVRCSCKRQRLTVDLAVENGDPLLKIRESRVGRLGFPPPLQLFPHQLVTSHNDCPIARKFCRLQV